MTPNPTRTALSAACLIAALCLGACATSGDGGGGGMSKEDMLTAAGFKTKPADTPEKVAELKKLPPLQLVKRDHNGKQLVLYADPRGCRCVFYGDQAALEAYRQERFAKHLVEENEAAATQDSEAAMMNENAAAMNNFGWGAWNEGWGPY